MNSRYSQAFIAMVIAQTSKVGEASFQDVIAACAGR